jgi:uncharacterized protein YcsI (UPF0317 family)
MRNSNLAVSRNSTIPLTGIAVRHQCRSGVYDGPTSGLAPGYV